MTVEKLEKLYDKYRINEEEVKDYRDAFMYVTDEISDIESVWDIIEMDRRENDFAIKSIAFNKKIYNMFKRVLDKPKVEDPTYYNRDNLVLLEGAQLVVNNLEYFGIIRDALDDDNYLELVRLAAFLSDHFENNLEALGHIRDIVAMEKKGEVVHEDGPKYYNDVVDEFAKRKLSVIDEKRIAYTKVK